MEVVKALNRLVGLMFGVTLSFCGCDSPVTFTSPQPETDKNESHFNWRYRGSYINLQDSALLVIDKHHIRREWSIILETTKSEIDSSRDWHIKDEKLYLDGNPQPYKMAIYGDSVRVQMQWVDTLFRVSETHVIRKSRGFYFLNTMYDPQSWYVEVLKLDRDGGLKFMEMRNATEIEQLEALTDVEREVNEHGEIVDLKLKPTKRQLKDLIRSGGFVRGKSFKKIE